MTLTLGAQTGARQVVDVWPPRYRKRQRPRIPLILRDTRPRELARKLDYRLSYFCESKLIWLAMHCHLPPRFIHVSVNRYVRSNILPPLTLPFSRAVPITIA